MRLIKFDGVDNPVYINPEHVVAVRKALRDTKIETVKGDHTVRETPEEVARMLGADDVTLDITPQLTHRGGL
jgi:hypothetical protein